MVLIKVLIFIVTSILATGAQAQSSGNGILDQSFFDNYIHRSVTIAQNPEVVRINYVDAAATALSNTTERGVILMIHGFGSTSYGFHKVISLFTQAGYRVIAPDNRGAGDSNHPMDMDGYRKTNLAADLHTLLQLHLNITQPVHVVGHDIGGLIAHAYSSQYPQDVTSVTWGECTIPGSTYFNEVRNSPQFWHYNFLRQLDLPETLTKDRVRQFFQWFFSEALIVNTAAINSAELDYIASKYEAAGGMRCGANLYRNFDRDAEDNLRLLAENGKSTVPSMSLFAANLIEAGASAGDEFYENPRRGLVHNSGHFIAKENPQEFVSEVLGFLESLEGAGTGRFLPDLPLFGLEH
ncbi:hypothetical protein PRZ48_007301 [Zasmidium cellare]|uniref:AB hydrolase-1 domain-containing protein n=1 Tax=Zasmidium cellare TaxID=395010 RepID=A0ABR0EJ74_ZASCE|nr:hypothetical protein PRZ48_007301 [Zasmidium cellare]